MANVERVLFGGVEAEYTNTETSITTTVPAGVTPGELQLAVYLPNGSDRVPFRVFSVPTVAEIDPSSGLPGTEVTVTGTFLNDVTSVRVGDAQAEFSTAAADGSSLIFTVPETAAPGNSTVTVTSRGGSADATFEVLADPAIISVDPVEGNVGAEVTISGVNFIDVESVMLGDLAIEEYTVNNSTNITFTVPEGAAGGIVTVTTAAGTASSEEPFTVIYDIPVNVDPVANDALMIFDFDEVNPIWGVGEVTASPAYTLDGSNYLRVNEVLDGWNAIAASNDVSNMPADVIGTDVSDYVLKFDIYIVEPITAGEIKHRLTVGGTDFWYNYKPWEGEEGGYHTDGWITVTVPLTDFRDADGNGTNTITDMSQEMGEWGMNWNGGPSKVNIAVDNYRFERIGDDDGGGDNGPVIDYYIYEDALHADWEHWGWEIERDENNTEHAQSGSAIKVTITSEWGGYTAHHAESNFDLSNYSTIVFSIYGGPSASDIQLFVKNADGEELTKVVIPVTEGEFTVHEIPLSDLGNPDNINELIFQNTGTPDNVFYIDNLGLR